MNQTVENVELREKSTGEKIAVVLLVVIPLMGVLYAIQLLWQRYVFPLDIALMLGLYLFSGLGITVGFHRMLTHRSFETSPVVKALFLIAGSMAIESNPINWASIHIEHHAHSDQDDDPHSPLVSFWHAHIGWMMNHVGKPDIYGTWLKKDPVVVWVDRYWLVWVVLGLALPGLIGGWTGFIWGGLVRVFLTHHITWAVNSICHTFGNRPYQTTDASRNNWLIGLLAFGEGWHNNHHAFPRSAFHGLRWWQFDLSAVVIRMLERVGLVWNVYRIRPEVEMKRRATPEGVLSVEAGD